MVLSIMRLKVWHMTQNVPYFCQLWAWRFYDFPTEILTGIFVVCVNKLTLPFKTGCKPLSVTSGDSSPKGRAKYQRLLHMLHRHKKRSISVQICSVNCFTDTHLMPGGFSASGHGIELSRDDNGRENAPDPMGAAHDW